ncbi:condensation domain-containing protein [Streptomyces sp. JNUCC 64]
MPNPVPTAALAHPLTSAQERLFFLHQLDTGAAMYVFPVHLELRGPVDADALRGALADIVERHEVLRSVIEVRDQRPVQIVREQGPELRRLDLRGLPAAERDHRVAEAVEREANAPFDFADSLMRALLVRRGEEDFLLLLGFHHIVFDGWSCAVLLRELTEGYRRHRNGSRTPVERLAVPYGAYAAMEARTADPAALRAGRDFWKDTLTPTPRNLSLVTDRPRPPALSGRAHRVWTHLDAALTAALERRSRASRATPYMLLLSAYQVVLARLGGQADFCVGGAASGRHDPVTHPMIGSLVNELVYRSDYEPGITFTELVSRVRRRALGVYRHDRLPFERVVELVTPTRSLSHHPLFQHAVSLQPPGPDFTAEGVEVRTLDSGAEGSALDVTTSFHQEGDRLACVVDFSADLWDAPWGEGFAQDLIAVLRALADDPDRPVDAVPLTSPVRSPAAVPGTAGPERPALPPHAPTGEWDRAVTTLLAIWRETLGLDALTPDQNFFDIGGDSLLGLRVVAAARQAGYPMRPRHMFLGQTVADLAALLTAGSPLAPGTSASSTTAQDDRMAGPVPLLPVQSWFLTGPDPGAGHYNYSNLFDIAPGVDDERLGAAVDAALAHHDAFRLRFTRSPSGEWTQSYGEAPKGDAMRRFDFSHLAPGRARAALDRAVRTCQSAIALDSGGPLVVCAAFTLPGGERTLLLTAHHLVMEPASMSILVDDITTACGQLDRGEEIVLLPQPSTYRDWGEALRDFAASPEVLGQREYWRRVTATAASALRVDHPDGRNDVASQRTLADSLDETTTRALRSRVTASTGASLTAVVLAGAAAGLRPVTDPGPLLIDFETHGREDVVDSVDLSRTIGWFASLFPLALPAPGRSARHELDDARRALRDVPTGGLGHGLLAFVSDEPLPRHRNPVGVTYLGSVGGGERNGGVLRFAGFPEHDRAPHRTRPHELEIGAMLSDGRLSFSVTYSANRYPDDRIRELLAAMRSYFERLADETDAYEEAAR